MSNGQAVARREIFGPLPRRCHVRVLDRHGETRDHDGSTPSPLQPRVGRTQDSALRLLVESALTFFLSKRKTAESKLGRRTVLVRKLALLCRRPLPLSRRCALPCPSQLSNSPVEIYECSEACGV